jgi:hypothetical protein
MRDAERHPGISIHRIPVGGGIMGALFAGCLSFQRCAFPATCRSPWAKTRNEIIRVGVLQFFIAAGFVNLAVSLPQYQFASHTFQLYDSVLNQFGDRHLLAEPGRLDRDEFAGDNHFLSSSRCDTI